MSNVLCTLPSPPFRRENEQQVEGGMESGTGREGGGELTSNWPNGPLALLVACRRRREGAREGGREPRKSFGLLASYVMLKLHARRATAATVHSSGCCCTIVRSPIPFLPPLVPPLSISVKESPSLLSLSILLPDSLPSGAAGIFTARGKGEGAG